MHKKDSKTSLADRIGNVFGVLTPTCFEGLRLVELGKQRPLKLHERVALLYNSPLCLHCNCKREKFDRERELLREIDRSR